MVVQPFLHAFIPKNGLLLAVSLLHAFGFAYCSFWFGCVQSMTAWVIASAHVLVAVGRRMFITDGVIAILSIRTKTSISPLGGVA